jgi:hypothetical protein
MSKMGCSFCGLRNVPLVERIWGNNDLRVVTCAECLTARETVLRQAGVKGGFRIPEPGTEKFIKP